MTAAGSRGGGGALDEPRVVASAAMEDPEVVAIGAGRAAVFSVPSPERKDANEDAAALIPLGADRAVLAVADGLGGQPAGELASRLALDTLREHVQAAVREGRFLREAILDGIDAANRAVCDLGLGAATTLAIAELRGSRLRSYHVGDSLVLVVGQRGKLKLQTISHSPVGYAVESGILDEREAMHHEDRHLVSNLVGAADMRIEMSSLLEIAPRDTVLLATDGLLDNLHIEEIVERVRVGSLRRAAQFLSGEAARRMRERPQALPSKPDDLTFVLFRRAVRPRAAKP